MTTDGSFSEYMATIFFKSVMTDDYVIFRNDGSKCCTYPLMLQESQFKLNTIAVTVHTNACTPHVHVKTTLTPA